MVDKKRWYYKQHIHELAFFIAMFILTMLHEWMQVDTIGGFLKGLVFFLIVYAQAQFQRFFVFPILLKKRYGQYALATFISTLIGASILYAADYFWLQPGIYEHAGFEISALIYQFVLCIVTTITIMSLFLMREYSLELQRRERDQLLLSEMNIRFLHAQLNPHFFFNMFNNLYGVSLADPQRVPDLILRLSTLMRYPLENGNKTTVSIQDEIHFIENYIAMEKERIGKRCAISFMYPQDPVRLGRWQVSPLILITLVENAFKHSLTIEHKWFVSIEITLVDHTLQVNILNSMPDKALQKNDSTGIGLANIRQRLELLYKGRYQFFTSEHGSDYQTNLTLQLNQF